MGTDSDTLITLCVSGFPGTNRSLLNLEKTTGLTKHLVLRGSDANAVEVEFYVEYIKERTSRCVLFGGWSPVYDTILKKLGNKKIEFGVYWTSSPGQVDISEEIKYLVFLLKSRNVKHRLFAHKELASALSGGSLDVRHLPDTVLFPDGQSLKQLEKRRKDFIISLFYSPFEYRRKNVLNSLLALSMLKNGYMLYLNGLSENEYYRDVLKTLGIRYKDFGWMTDDKYQNVLSEVDLGLQVSFAETFNFVVAEHIVKRVPVITSRMVPVMDCMPAYIKKRLLVDDPDSASEVLDKIGYLLGNTALLNDLGESMYKYLKRENEKRIETAKNVLKSIIERNKG
ncbi:MAG: hypothetical protein ACHQ6U_02110 [Thermodesulfobacteriota bacterium]